MTMFSRLVFLLCASLFLRFPTSQTPRAYKIHDLERLQKTVLKDVVEIKSINNLQSSNFPADFEIEMKNISNKPIYYMHVAVFFSETSRLMGNPYGCKLVFGNKNLININNLPDPTDIPAKPGENFVLRGVGVKNIRKLFESNMDGSNVGVALSKIVIFFQMINFGDRTGYLGATPIPTAKKVSQNLPGSTNLGKTFLASTNIGNSCLVSTNLGKSSLVSTENTSNKRQLPCNCDHWRFAQTLPCVTGECNVDQATLDSEVPITCLCELHFSCTGCQSALIMDDCPKNQLPCPPAS